MLGILGDQSAVSPATASSAAAPASTSTSSIVWLTPAQAYARAEQNDPNPPPDYVPPLPGTTSAGTPDTGWPLLVGVTVGLIVLVGGAVLLFKE